MLLKSMHEFQARKSCSMWCAWNYKGKLHYPNRSISIISKWKCMNWAWVDKVILITKLEAGTAIILCHRNTHRHLFSWNLSKFKKKCPHLVITRITLPFQTIFTQFLKKLKEPNMFSCGCLVPHLHGLEPSPPSFFGVHRCSQETLAPVFLNFGPIQKKALRMDSISCITFLGRINKDDQ